jgi:hypothetical protein
VNLNMLVFIYVMIYKIEIPLCKKPVVKRPLDVVSSRNELEPSHGSVFNLIIKNTGLTDHY